jgi:TonB family protein
VFVAPKLMSKDENKPSAQVAQTAPTPPPPPQVPTAGSAEQPATNTPDTPTPPTTDTPPTPDTPTNDTPPPDTTPKTPPTQTKRGGTTQTKRGGTTPTTGPVTTPDKGTTTTPPPDDKPIETKTAPPSGDPTCDEVSCVLSKYDRPCCERYNPKETDIAKRSGSLPEDLDRAAVRSGIEKVKPAVVQCGEKAGVKGTVKISVSVAPEGNVTASDVAESPDSALGSCVAAAIKRATFSKTVNGGSFTYPFVF